MSTFSGRLFTDYYVSLMRVSKQSLAPLASKWLHHLPARVRVGSSGDVLAEILVDVARTSAEEDTYNTIT